MTDAKSIIVYLLIQILHLVRSNPKKIASRMYRTEKPYRVLNVSRLVSRPDISYAVNLVSRYCNKHNHSHWLAVKRIFKYLIGTANHDILYECGGSQVDMNLCGYSDADFAGDVDTRKSTTGYTFCINNSLVTWSSQRQKLVSLSTTESEYVAAATACKEPR
ncbi:uncharacterized protein [Temnothorax longispinosus]|uniref:uncharacterized protein n=1 Tax=Temnothorax longispinosus TaxID=300112 RepID=UPI003A9A213E